MKIPVYVVTGFLDAGKTTLLNELFCRLDWQDSDIAAFRFESGEASLADAGPLRTDVLFSKDDLDNRPDSVAERMRDLLLGRAVDEVWIEWNGVTPFARLEDLLLHPALRDLCKLDKVVHVADAAKLEGLLGRTGDALPEQAASCDLAVVRGVYTARGLKKFRRLFRGLNPGVRVYGAASSDEVCRQLFRKKRAPLPLFLFSTAVAVALYLLVTPLLTQAAIPANKVVNIFLGIILQAVPFLLIGVLLSSAIQIFVSRSAVESRFPKTVGIGIPVAILAGFCLPVCDCASIPIFRSLVKKGVPLSAAVTFMLVSPVINPVVILSTYYAFSGNMRVVIGRVCLGLISAVVIGLVFALRPPRDPVLAGGALDRFLCGCGCYEDAASVATARGKADLFFRHAQAEFFDVGRYLVIGVFVSAVFQAFGVRAFVSAQSGAGLAFSVIVMMLMGFALSLCSSSDAVVARSFASGFPQGALMGFMVFGPMMDIKNVLMLSSCFSRRFVTRLAVTTFAICFIVVFLFSDWGGVALW
ncbi:MAG: permease [Clostridiales Family XIII bacterium]|jgi:uncharacterized membrane protein YraQ (UPF0718 family)|nr:permease [Clostridiales Family XIII bacterium]